MRALARVNLAAIERNVSRLRAGLSDGAELCAVVKADGRALGSNRFGENVARSHGGPQLGGWTIEPHKPNPRVSISRAGAGS